MRQVQEMEEVNQPAAVELAAEAAVPEQAFIASNPRMRALYSALEQIARANAAVVIQGESGVGKRTLARQIHALSDRADQPFVAVNCAACGLQDLESELFGALGTRSVPSKLAFAGSGSILLEEIDDLPMSSQSRLLRVLEIGELPVARGYSPIKINGRVLATTRKDFAQIIREQRFRADLYYRLSGISIEVPPLRERRDEILPLARLFLQKYARPSSPAPALSSSLESALIRYLWPGNIRELDNAMQRVIIFEDPDLVARNLFRRRPLT